MLWDEIGERAVNTEDCGGWWLPVCRSGRVQVAQADVLGSIPSDCGYFQTALQLYLKLNHPVAMLPSCTCMLSKLL